MIKTGTGSIDLRELELILQEKLDSFPLGVVSALINCVVREPNLIILVQYPEPVMPYPKKIFHLLRETLNALQISENYQVLMYLVVVGENRAHLAPTFFESLEPAKTQDLALTPEDTISQLLPVKAETKSPTVALKSNFALKPLLIKAIGVSVSIGALLTLLYGVTRPCVIGQCQVIPQAENLASSANFPAEVPLSLTAVEHAQADLTKSLTLLSTIPSWSIKHFEALQLKNDYQQKLSSLEQLQKAFQWEKQAKEFQTRDLSSLQKQQQLLTQAITALTTIPQSSNYYKFAQDKIQQSQEYLVTLNNNLDLETQAKKNLDSAEEAAKLGEIRASVAQSVSNWQQVEGTWKTAIQRLQAIPSTSSFSLQTQQLLNKYQDNLTFAINKKQQETQANQLAQMATNQAKNAQTAENNNDWSQAVANWQGAVNALKQVSKTSFEYNRTLPLINDYNARLQKASNKLQASLDIQKVCVSNILICNYSIKEEAIEIYLTPDYLKEIGEIAQLAQAEKNPQTKKNLNTHISSLEQSLRTISQNTQLPVLVYNSNNVLMVKYLPN